MATVKKFIWLDQDGQMREQTANETIQVANGVASADAINKGQLDSAVGSLTDLVNAEAARAAQAEAALGDSLTAETAARVAGDAALSASLTSETNARTSADTALGGRIDTEIADRQAAITAEESARTAADAALRTDLDAEVAARIAAVSAEQTARENADDALDARIDALESSSNSALAAAVASLTADIEAEEAARIAADSALQSALDAEIARAGAAEAAEQAARIAADNALTSSLNAEISRAQAAEGVLTADLAAEAARATAAEAALSSSISAEQSRAQAAESQLTSDLAAEITRAEAAEAAIAADLAAEISRATASETAKLQEAKDYADARVQGLSWKASVDYAFPRTGTYTLPADAASFISGEEMGEGDRVLVYSPDQSAHADNGIYVVVGSTLVRAADMQAGKDAAGAIVYVEAGSPAGAAPGTSFVCANQGTAIVGTDALTFVVASRMENLSFTGGVQKNGTSVSLKLENTSPVYVNGANELTLRISGDELDVNPSNGTLFVTGDLVGGTFVSADAKHTHEALAKSMASSATVGVVVDSAGAAVNYDSYVSFGCVDEKSGSDARVVFSGLCNVAAGALSSFTDGERVFLGSAAGVFAKYADIPSGKWAVPVGYKQGSKLFVHREPAAQKA